MNYFKLGQTTDILSQIGMGCLYKVGIIAHIVKPINKQGYVKFEDKAKDIKRSKDKVEGNNKEEDYTLQLKVKKKGYGAFRMFFKKKCVSDTGEILHKPVLFIKKH